MTWWSGRPRGAQEKYGTSKSDRTPPGFRTRHPSVPNFKALTQAISCKTYVFSTRSKEFTGNRQLLAVGPLEPKCNRQHNLICPAYRSTPMTVDGMTHRVADPRVGELVPALLRTKGAAGTCQCALHSRLKTTKIARGTCSFAPVVSEKKVFSASPSPPMVLPH